MIRSIVFLWALPLGFFWSWYFLSLNDLSFGLMFFSKALHDQVFGIYGNLLGVDPASIPPMIAKSLAVDSVVVGAFVAFRKRRAIQAWIKARRHMSTETDLAAQAPDRRNEESLSSAP